MQELDRKINQGRYEFLCQFNIEPDTMYLGEMEYLTLAKSVYAPYTSYTKDKYSYAGLDIIFVKKENYFALGFSKVPVRRRYQD